MARQKPDGSFSSDRPTRPNRWSDFTPASGVSGAFTWGDFNADDILELVRCVTVTDDAISFATNRPKTGGSITILSGGPPVKLYVSDAESWQRVFREIIKRYTDG